MWFKPTEYENPNHSAIATIATIATKSLNDVSLSQKSRMSQPVKVSGNNFSQSENVAIVAKVAAGLKADDRQKLLDYLAAIGETDQAMIDEYLDECGSNADTLTWALQEADDCLQIKTGNTTGFLQCSGCNQLTGDTCQLHGWRVVVDKWRRCDDFQTIQKTTSKTFLITCKTCDHFQSYKAHGGGAGACNAGVMPLGACWWADTLHDCGQWSAKHD